MNVRVVVACGLAVALAACTGNGTKGEIAASGTIETRQVDVAPKVSGQLTKLAVDEGDRIEAGAVLALVDQVNLEIELKQAEATADAARAQLILLQEGARREDIQQTEEQLKQADASLGLAAQDAERMRALEKTGSATPKQREDADARLVVAKSQRSAAQEALNKARRLSRPQEIKAAEARLAQAEAAADLLKKMIADCTVIAPVSGFVTHRAVEAGEFIAQGSTIVTISRLDSVYVMIYITEVELGRVRLGDAADVRVDAFPGRVFPGRVTYISQEAEFTPKNIETKEDRVKLVFGVKVEIDNKDGLLKPGLPADAVIRVIPPAS